MSEDKNCWWNVLRLLASMAAVIFGVHCLVRYQSTINPHKRSDIYSRVYGEIFPRSYHAAGFLSLPFDDIVEPFQAWYSGDFNMSRIDYYHGMDKTIQRGNFGKYGEMFKIVPMHSDISPSNNDYISCWYKNLPKWFHRQGQTVVPLNLETFVISGKEVHRGQLCYKLVRKNIQYNKTNTYILYVTAHAPIRPLRFEMIGYDDMMMSHYDHYVIDYTKFEPWTINSTVFDVPAKVKCNKKQQINSYLMNPMAEFLHFHHAKDVELERSYHNYKKKHRKTYSSTLEHERRKHIYKHNLRFIHSKNRQHLRYVLKSNHLADLTDDEMHLQNGLLHEHAKPQPSKHIDFNISKALKEIPDNLDWREYGAVSPVHSQGICGSCWAFSALGAVEGMNFLKTGKLVELSKQQLLDCSWPVGNHGCRGGFQARSLRWIKRNGVATKKEYGKYLAQEGFCHCGKVNCTTVHIDGFMHVKKHVPLLLKIALATHGPIASSVNSDSKTFRFYSHGIYDDVQCKRKTNHAVLTVGYGNHKGTAYWLIRNSWGHLWGENGYIKIATKDDICGTTSGSLIAIKKSKEIKEFPFKYLTKLPETSRDNFSQKEEIEPLPFK